MSANPAPSPSPVDALHSRLEREAEAAGYHLNPDREFTRTLVEGLLVNEGRYGYRVCPCRLASGNRDKDRDIVCPCDYRDADLLDWGSCFCGLYVSDEVLQEKRPLASVPERRPQREARGDAGGPAFSLPKGRIQVWRCRVCGYLCARDRPPAVCPICKATQDRFEPFG